MSRSTKREAMRLKRREAKQANRRESQSAAGGRQPSVLTPAQSTRSQSARAPAAKVALLEGFDNFAALRNGLRRVAADQDEWAGIPMPLQGERLVIAPQFPNAAILSSLGRGEPEDDTSTLKVRNQWWSDRLRAEVFIWEEDGKIQWGKVGCPHHITMDLHTMGCSVAWGIEQEHNAIQLLGTLVRHHQLKQYLLTGMFMETSKRSGLTYVFRRLKPTVVLDNRDRDGKGSVRILTTLCMHTIGYYAGTWAGALCPSDDVVAFLMLMRADEHGLWKKSTHHHPSRPEAGL